MKKHINMYEDKYKNPKNNAPEDLENFLHLLADLDTEIELFALGGTAMVLANIKESTKDIDFLTTLEYSTIRRLFELAGLKEVESSKACNIWYLNGIRIDIFYDEFILGVTLPDDWKNLSEHVRNIGKLKVYILNWYDIIITKLARSEERDILDIIDIIKNTRIDFNILKKRYYSLAEDSLIVDYNLKFRHLEEKYDSLKTNKST